MKAIKSRVDVAEQGLKYGNDKPTHQTKGAVKIPNAERAQTLLLDPGSGRKNSKRCD